MELMLRLLFQIRGLKVGRMLRKSASRWIRLAAAGCLLRPSVVTHAEDRSFVGLPSGGTANWSTASNWSGAAVPEPGDTAIIDYRDSLSRTITLDVSANLTYLGIVNFNGGGSTTLYQPPGINLTADGEFVSFYPTPDYGIATGAHVQDGGINYIGDLYVGGETADQNRIPKGSYVLNGGKLNVGLLEVAGIGFGTFEQNGGSVNASATWLGGAEVRIGGQQHSSGVY